MVPEPASKCRHCHNYLGFSFQWVWEEGVRALGLVAMIAAAIVAWKSLELTVVAQKEKDLALSQAMISQQERDALKEDLKSGAVAFGPVQKLPLSGAEKVLHIASEKSNDLRVRQLLARALSLKLDDAPFRMGGKSPDEGFDASGFVSFLLSEAGALDPRYYRTFSVVKLEKSFPKVRPEDAKPGDLVFLGANFVAISLGSGQAVGIGSETGILVFSVSPKTKKSFHRWAYGQDSRMLQ